MIKKITSFIFAIVMLVTFFTSTITSYAMENENVIQSDTIILDGVAYKFETLSNKEDRITRITNLVDNTQNIVHYNEKKGVVYLDDKVIAYVENIPTEMNASVDVDTYPLTATTRWVYHDTSTTRITWAMGTSVAVVAGIIAAVIPGTSALVIIAKIGLSALSVIAGTSIGGTITCVAYTQVLLDGSVQFRYDWTFTASTGDKYGPYSTYQL